MDDYNTNQTTQTSLGSGMTGWKHVFISQLLPDKLCKNRARNKLYGQFPTAPKYALLVVLKSITELWEHLNSMQHHYNLFFPTTIFIALMLKITAKQSATTMFNTRG